MEKTADRLRLAELMASLSLAIDLSVGQPTEWVIRSCLLGVALGERLGLSQSEQQQVYYLSLLRHIGCTANAPADATLFGNELGVAELMTVDMNNMGAVLPLLIRLVGKDQPALQRLQTLLRVLTFGSEGANANHLGQCEVARGLAVTLGFDETIQDALWQLFERWDGRGIPNHLKGDELLPSVRVIYLAQDAATFYTVAGIDAAIKIARERSGHLYDPDMVDTFCRLAPSLLAHLDTESNWEAVLAAEPADYIWLTGEEIERALQAAGDFGDMKSSFTRGHSRSVATLAEAAARHCGLPDVDVTAVRRASYIHDIGKVGITASIWEKSGVLSESEQERIRLHPYLTERIFARAVSLQSVGMLGAMHHERLDGTGYHRGLLGTMLPITACLLAAANAYCALIEPRPHRSTHSPEQAAEVLSKEIRHGHLEEKAVHAVLNAAGHRVRNHQTSPSEQLSPREIEVLRLITRGLSNRKMAEQLVISEKTVGHHIQHIYNKIGVSTRAGATLFAMQNHLLSDLV